MNFKREDTVVTKNKGTQVEDVLSTPKRSQDMLTKAKNKFFNIGEALKTNKLLNGEVDHQKKSRTQATLDYLFKPCPHKVDRNSAIANVAHKESPKRALSLQKQNSVGAYPITIDIIRSESCEKEKSVHDDFHDFNFPAGLHEKSDEYRETAALALERPRKKLSFREPEIFVYSFKDKQRGAKKLQYSGTKTSVLRTNNLRQSSSCENIQLESQAMRVVRTVGQAFEVCHKLSINAPEAEHDEHETLTQDLLSDHISDAMSDKPKKDYIIEATSDKHSLPIEENILEDLNFNDTNKLLRIPPTDTLTSPTTTNCNRKMVSGETYASHVIDEFQTGGSGSGSMANTNVFSTGSAVSTQHEIQLLKEQLEQQSQQTQAALAQLQLVREQLATEQSARMEAQARTHQLLVHNKELLDHIAALVSHLQGGEQISAQQNTGPHVAMPQRCIPEFQNAAFNLLMEATNTCGEEKPIEFCIQTGVSSIRKSCEVCHRGQYSASFLTDFHSQDSQTWWQSETMYEGIQFPQQVNLTLHLEKSFDVTYVRVWFSSPRPESFAIYKRACEDCAWIPYQFYSATCRDTYGLPDNTATLKGEETRALCTSEYSDISPLRDGNVAFSTLEGRPSAYQFDSSQELQEWVTATDIRISLDRLNTFGDEVFGDLQVLRSYFYAIAEVAVGARCKCNGHASECIASTSLDGTRRLVCKCEHRTTGTDCNECLPFYNDAPWGRASDENAHECKPCNCNEFSDRCFFDKELYERTGHGGHCLDCMANRDGPNCERCRPNYYQREDSHCIACECDETGSRSLQCNSEGKCQCKTGITGDKCDRCEINHYDFGNHGCKECGCLESGSANNEPNCDPYTGTCTCKNNVEGKQCRECKPGFFNLNLDNEFGCTPCFCYGHSSECRSAPYYSRYQIESMFSKSSEKWKAEDQYHRSSDIKYSAFSQSIGISAPGEEPVYFLAPDRYLGDHRESYNQILQFTLRIEENHAIPTATDIILEGAGGYVSNTIFAQRNPLPTTESQVYKFRLHEHPNYGWQPRLLPRAFISILTNLTAIRIKGTYSSHGVGYLDDVKLETAARGIAGNAALWIEQCECPTGYVGQFCESCAPGYRHSPSHGGPFSPCIPCDCNKHADICDAETGRCICEHNTTGDNCDLCAKGYYGNALAGTPDDCQPCGCPEGGACIQLEEEIVMCVECPVGYTGHHCDSCADGYFGDPIGRYGTVIPCQSCECNLNIDQNGIGNCNTTTGECLKCIHNTGGSKCEQCLPGFYGDALALPKGDCKPCQCYELGSQESFDGSPICDQISGDCRCKSHVLGRNCDRCEDGFYNIAGGEGCQSCDCHEVGSLNNTCDISTGQCFCRPGITGLHCDRCEDYKYGFSVEGCKSCECDAIGSKDLQCDPLGQCPCLDNVEGRQCERCKENKYDRQRGCINCPDCYNLVQDASNTHTHQLEHLAEILTQIEQNPTVVDSNFENQLKYVQEEAVLLLENAKKNTGGSEEQSISEKLDEVSNKQKQISRVLSEIEENIDIAKEKGEEAEINVKYTEQTLGTAESELKLALDNLESEGKEALEKAEQRAKEFGQQSEKMTVIAQKARELADKLDNQADTLNNTAVEAKLKSIEAYEQAKNATDIQRNVSMDVYQLKVEISNTQTKLVNVKQWIQDVYNKSHEVRNRTLVLLNEVNSLVVPDIDLPDLKLKVESAKEQANKILNETMILNNKSRQLLINIADQLIISDNLLTRGIDQQDQTIELLSEIDLARASADNAINLGQEILKEANSTFETISHFDKQVKESQAAAQQALERIPDITLIIEEAINKIDAAETSLADSKQNANHALQTAVQANNLAKSASELAENIRVEAEYLSQNATGLKEEAGLMTGRVENTENEYQLLLRQIESNETLISDAKEKIGRADADSKEATKKVNEILEDINIIITQLKNSRNLSHDELNQLEDDLIRAEHRVADANLNSIVDQLKKESKEQNMLVEAYNNELKWLRREVENVKEIANALPEGCFKAVLQLEP